MVSVPNLVEMGTVIVAHQNVNVTPDTQVLIVLLIFATLQDAVLMVNVLRLIWVVIYSQVRAHAHVIKDGVVLIVIRILAKE